MWALSSVKPYLYSSLDPIWCTLSDLPYHPEERHWVLQHVRHMHVCIQTWMLWCLWNSKDGPAQNVFGVYLAPCATFLLKTAQFYFEDAWNQVPPGVTCGHGNHCPGADREPCPRRSLWKASSQTHTPLGGATTAWVLSPKVNPEEGALLGTGGSSLIRTRINRNHDYFLKYVF